MSTEAGRVLEAARQQIGLSSHDLWLGYYGLGGRGTPADLDDVLAGRTTPTPADYDVIAHALNERFLEQDRERPVPYADELDLERS